MRLRPAVCALGLLACLAGCGPQSYADRARSAVDQLRSATQSYNQTASADLSAQGTSCAEAAKKLGSGASPFQHGSVPARYRREAALLTPAYRLTLRGLTDCATAASTLNYPLMVKAMARLTEANIYIEHARRLDH